MTPDPDDTAESVRRGAELLDRVRPGWEAEVDTSRLDMADETADILGQLWGSYRIGFLAVTRPLSASRLWSAAEFGFGLRDSWQALANPQRREEGWGELTNLWIAEIRARGGEG